MLEGNLAEFIEQLTDDEFRFLITFVKVDLNLPDIHAGSVFFVSRAAVCNKIERILEQRNRPSGHSWPKTYAEVQDLLADAYKILKNIQRKVERRSFTVQRRVGKERKYLLTLCVDGKYFISQWCRTEEDARHRGSYWATGRKHNGEGRHSAGREPPIGGTLEGEAA